MVIEREIVTKTNQSGIISEMGRLLRTRLPEAVSLISSKWNKIVVAQDWFSVPDCHDVSEFDCVAIYV